MLKYTKYAIIYICYFQQVIYIQLSIQTPQGTEAATKGVL